MRSYSNAQETVPLRVGLRCAWWWGQFSDAQGFGDMKIDDGHGFGLDCFGSRRPVRQVTDFNQPPPTPMWRNVLEHLQMRERWGWSGWGIHYLQSSGLICYREHCHHTEISFERCVLREWRIRCRNSIFLFIAMTFLTLLRFNGIENFTSR